MKLMRLGEPGSERPAVRLDDGRVIDVSSVVADYDAAFLGGDGIEALRERLAKDTGDFPSVDLGRVRVGAPVARPGHIIAIGLNYADHAKEAGMEIPSEPIIFSKAPSSVCGPNDTVLIPRASEKTDWEVELGVIIGATARYLADEAAAMAHVAGYCVINDVSERSFQLERSGQWMKGKSAETFCPMGPWLVTRDEVPEPQNLALKCSVSGQAMQDGRTDTMIFGVAHLVWYLSQFMVLEPGDAISTGTPPGVGAGQKPPRFLRPGDVMELEVEGLGQQRQEVAQA